MIANRFFLLGLWLFSQLVFAGPQVLVIHSYHPGFFWTDSIETGLEQELADSDITLRHTYLDTKRYQSSAYRQQLKHLYAARLKDRRYDAILTTDNAALWLVNQLGEVVGDTPVVFSGLNTFTASSYPAIERLTGVLEQINLPDNVALMKRHHPELTRVYVVLDNAFSSRQYWNTLQQQLDTQGSGGIEVVRLDNETFAGLVERGRTMEQGEALFFVSYFKDSAGEFMPHGRLLEALTAATRVPVYGASSFMLTHGVIGGNMVDGETQGRYQAKILQQVLAGPGRLPGVVEDATVLMFDFLDASSWWVDIAGYPQAIVTRLPVSWWEDNRKTVLTSLLVISALIILAVALGRGIRQQRRSEQALAQSRALFKGVFDQSHQFIALLDFEGKVVSANKAFLLLFPDYRILEQGPIWKWPGWLDDRRLQFYVSSLLDGQTSRFELCLVADDQRELTLDVARKALPDQNMAQARLLFEARDITKRKLTEQKLQRSEVEYRLLYEHQPVMMLTIDRKSRIQSVNQIANDLLGYTKTGMLGHKVTDFYKDDDSSPQQLIALKSDRTDQIWRRDICYLARDGREVWIRESLRPTPVKSQLLLVGEDITATRRLEVQLRHQAQHDHLTGLFNRSYFEMKLDETLQQSGKNGAGHALFYIDLDQFKVINDTVGHEAGDEALKQTARMLENLLPPDGLLARIGGDEFAIICRNYDEEKALALGDKILDGLAGTEFFWDGARMILNCSIGVRILDDTAGTAQQVHAQADTACYAAKDQGRSRLHLYRPDDQLLKKRENEMAYVSYIHAALAEDRFEVHAQPIVSVATQVQGKMYFEVLIRMKDSQGRPLSPGLFIPAAERYNIAHLIDRAMIEKTLGWFARYPGYIDCLAMVSINLSGRSMANQDFIQFLIGAISDSVVPSSCICLDITETAAIGNMENAVDLFTRLRELGCTIALDDFGSGLSSFGYLKKLPVDIIKIDGQFVRDIAEDEMDFVMVRAINELAKQMGKKTVAEFVESPEILERLQMLGVDYAQGYHFSMPRPMQDLVRDFATEDLATIP